MQEHIALCTLLGCSFNLEKAETLLLTDAVVFDVVDDVTDFDVVEDVSIFVVVDVAALFEVVVTTT